MTTSERYEVTVTFLIDQPVELELGRHEIEDNVRMEIAENMATIGFATIVPDSINVDIEVAS